MILINKTKVSITLQHQRDLLYRRNTPLKLGESSETQLEIQSLLRLHHLMTLTPHAQPYFCSELSGKSMFLIT